MQQTPAHYHATGYTLQPATAIRTTVPTYLEALREARTLIGEALPPGGTVEDASPDSWDVFDAATHPVATIDVTRCPDWWCAPGTQEVPALVAA